MHIHEEELNRFQKENLSTSDMIAFLDHLDGCDFCLEQLLREEQISQRTTRIQAPSYMKQQILRKATSPEVQASKAAIATSHRAQLLYYSLQTAVGIVTALFLLFTAANAELPLFHRDFPIYREFSPADVSSFKDEAPSARNRLYDFARNIGSEISEGTGTLTKHLKDFPNNLLNGGK